MGVPFQGPPAYHVVSQLPLAIFTGPIVYLYGMKTTIEIPDPLLRELKSFAAKHNLTVRRVVERAVRDLLKSSQDSGQQFRLRDGSFRGQGLHAGVSYGDWEAIRAASYEGRGG